MSGGPPALTQLLTCLTSTLTEAKANARQDSSLPRRQSLADRLGNLRAVQCQVRGEQSAEDNGQDEVRQGEPVYRPPGLLERRLPDHLLERHDALLAHRVLADLHPGQAVYAPCILESPVSIQILAKKEKKRKRPNFCPVKIFC